MKPILGVITMKDLYFIVLFVLLSLKQQQHSEYYQ